MANSRHRFLGSLASGLAGALALTLLHESARRVVPRAPRMDVLGRRGLAKVFRAAGSAPPPRDELQAMALAGDVLSNSLTYALVGVGAPAWAPARGLVLGALAGLGGVALPPVLGLGPGPDQQAPSTRVMTVAWYAIGGLVAGEVYRRSFARGS